MLEPRLIFHYLYYILCVGHKKYNNRSKSRTTKGSIWRILVFGYGFEHLF
ncbi:hypothetical protein Hanom_Chr00s000003g01605941 [Helianthus anomalus]